MPVPIITGCNQACRSSNFTWNQDGMNHEVITVSVRTDFFLILMIRRLDFDAYSYIRIFDYFLFSMHP